MTDRMKSHFRMGGAAFQKLQPDAEGPSWLLDFFLDKDDRKGIFLYGRDQSRTVKSGKAAERFL